MHEARTFGAWAVLLLVCSALGACGRFGVHLVPLDAGNPAASDAESGDADADTTYGRDAGRDGSLAADGGEPLPMMCAAPSTMQSLCGCVGDTGDSDGDGVPDCSDFCPNGPEQRDDGSCACPAADGDGDGDGVANCKDRCPRDADKVAPGACGCNTPDRDGDGDGTPDCVDDCPTDPDKTQPGDCGCGASDQDTDLDGTPDCHDACKGTNDAGYVVDSSCGVGYCHAHNQPSACVAGSEHLCMAAAPLSQSDATCDGIDDDCDGKIDENFLATDTTCGVGVCASTGKRTCTAGVASDSCKPGSMTSANDATCDARDDDCDGKTDENFPVTPTNCSTGACASTGSSACVMGMMVDSCTATMPTATSDTTCNNTDDDCDARVDEEFVSTATNCGVGVCARTGSLTCVSGTTVNSCKAGAATNANDTQCDKLDGDCDGRTDEGYTPSATKCGQGACASTGMLTCVNGAPKNSCVAKTPATTVDDATVPGNGIDDDCDGKIDENVPACDTTAKTYEAGVYTNIAIPGNCHSVKVELWGGGGGGGQNEGTASGGAGGPGGYATATVLVAKPLNLYVGAAAKNDCSSAGTNSSSASYNGGTGGSGTGADGADGAVSGGGSGGQPDTGARGGNGFYGGGGGGQGSGGLGNSGSGGGGGAASVLVVNGTVAAAAGGGGGGGGAQAITILGTLAAEGGAGGSGCRGNGQVASGNGGGGGGGGMCKGSSTQGGSGTTPANSGKTPSGRAKGGGTNCGAGGAGYAILTFSP